MDGLEAHYDPAIARVRGFGASLRRLAAASAAAIALTVLPAYSRGAETGPIDEAESVVVAGAQLYLLLRGEEQSAPILLWLHGGPGGAERPLLRFFNAELEQHFVVAYWDQRGAGRSFDPEAPRSALTIARHVADLDGVVSHLHERFPGRAIVLVGHSWGGALSLLYARDHAREIAALAVVSPLIATRAGNEAEYEFVTAEASRRGDAALAEEARRLGPPPYATAAQVVALERISDRLGAVYHRPPAKLSVVTRGLARGLVTPWEIPRLIRANDVSLAVMHAELQTLDLHDSVREIGVPVIFLLGRHDRHVDSRIAASYLDSLKAPVKRVIWFEESAHNPPFEEPARFNAVLRAELSAIGVPGVRGQAAGDERSDP